jgi:beta-lactam-binding protein with PASTA domain
MKVIDFLKSKLFWKHFLIANIAAIVLIGSLVLGLNVFTKHGDFEIVPDFKMLFPKDIGKQLDGTRLIAEINDSAYNIKAAKGIILEQDPPPGTKVKPGRKIYLTINRLQAPKVAMPNLIDLSVRQANQLLDAYGLKLGKITYVSGFPPILEQRYKGSIVKPGDLVERGAVIDLVAGRGDGAEDITIPDLFGLNLMQVRDRLSKSKLMLGEIYSDDTVNDTAAARVYKQLPDPDLVDKATVKNIDIWLTESKMKLNNDGE